MFGTRTHASAPAHAHAHSQHPLAQILALVAVVMAMLACGSTVTITEQGTPAGTTPGASTTPAAGGSTGTGASGGGASTGTSGGGGAHPVPTPTHTPAPPAPTPTSTPVPAPPTLFVQLATASNSFGDFTTLSGCACTGHADATLFVTPNWNPGGVGGVYDDHPIGVYYRGPNWAIFNEDGTHIPVGAAFNVWMLAAGAPFVQVAASGNIGSDYTIIDRGGLNSNPGARLLVTANWNPPGSAGVYNAHPLGVFYIASQGRWAIFNQDRAGMPVGAAFNVVDLNTLAAQGSLLWTGSVANSTFDYTTIDRVGLNGNANALLFVTPNWNPAGATGVYDNHNIGVYYNGYAGKWAIFNQDQAPIPSGAAFNVWVAGSRIRIAPPIAPPLVPPVSAQGS